MNVMNIFPLRSGGENRVVEIGASEETKFGYVEKHRGIPPPKEEGMSSALWSFDLDTGTVSLDSIVGKAVHHSCVGTEKNGINMKVKAVKAQEKARLTLAKRRAVAEIKRALGGAGGE
ncbi:MAG: hypothetical protein YSLV5_ORF25 [Yellowstone Lake virophage 5]|uniref:Uncharacterized protein n=1 Tax=Yellowstone Lake virophage 5 TaxID=1557033 RepID=A0A0A0RK62_9VIRU|nr:MAG: hypothetical protein ASQ69_gp25 [Yellowstone Lake virophage 5]AIW01883.1 MAG: hypothetical protein YSLV5_ORF25 [Yellowstone Lake virophage 5]